MAVPSDASPLQILITAAQQCPAFRQAQIQVARRTRFYYTDRHLAPAFEAHAAQGAQIGEVRDTEAPTVPSARHRPRWQSSFLHVVLPRDNEDLWPVTEVVIHSRYYPVCRLPLDFEQDPAALLVRARTHLGITPNSAWRIPTHCPAEIRCPLHLFLFDYVPWDPWNDVPDEPLATYGLFDLRRLSPDAAPAYDIFQLPAIFDLTWIRQTVREAFPLLPDVAVAYMGEDPVTGACSPCGRTPLITVFPRSRFANSLPGMTAAILDTQALLAIRSGWPRLPPRPDVPGSPAAPSQAAPPRESALHPHNRAARQNTPSLVRFVLDPTGDESLQDLICDGLEQCEVMVFQPDCVMQEVCVPHHLRPQSFFTAIAQGTSCDDRCTLHVPTLAPLVPGCLPSAVLIPPHCHTRRFLFVDARRVCTPPMAPFWIQEVPHVLNPVIIISMLCNAQPCIGTMGAFFVDCISVRGYVELTAKVSLLTVLPAGFDALHMPNPLLNCQALRMRSGFVQQDCRFGPRQSASSSAYALSASYALHSIREEHQPLPPSITSTTTTSTTPVDRARLLCSSGDVRGSYVMAIEGKLIRFHAAAMHGPLVIAALRGEALLEDVLTQLCVQLHDDHALHPGMTFQACERVISDTDWEYSVFLTIRARTGPAAAWIDARPMGLPPFTLTDASLAHACGIPIPPDVCIAVNGAPWMGEQRSLRHCDVVSVRASFFELFTLPLAAVESRVHGFIALLMQQGGPDYPWPVRDPETGHFLQHSLATDFTVVNIRSHWELVRIACRLVPTEGGDYQKCLLVAADIPSFPCTVACRVAPSEAAVDLWYRNLIRPFFGPRRWRNTGLAFGDVTLLFDRCIDATSRRP